MTTKLTTPNITAERIREYLSEGKRFDGRKPDEYREISIESGVSKNAEGSVRVKIGKTEVLVGIKMNISEPYPDSPDKGNLMVTAELLPLSSPRFESGPPKFEAIELGRIIDRGIRESKLINMEKLCIEKGEKVWTVFVDIYSLNDDGNLLDAAGIGAVAALKLAKIPKYDAKEEKVLFGESSDKNILLAKNVTFPITIYKIGDNLIVDPTKEEEDVSETRITIGRSENIISSMQKGNPGTISVESMGKVIDLSAKVWKDVFKKAGKFLK